MAATAGLALAACSFSNGLSAARQACGHVDQSISLFHQSVQDQAASPARAGVLLDQAYAQLLVALPLASSAAEASGTWQALRTTLSEESRVPLGQLVPALKAQCAMTKSGAIQ
ncbi:MAG: hypothetical protein ACRD0I_11560 [Acidimicrobiales bacterium]